MDRRAFLKSVAGAGALTAAGVVATPAVSQRAAARALRFMPVADLANLDPIWSVHNISRNAGLLVWDTLYGADAKLQVQRQMVEAEEVSSDGLVWTFRLRSGLKFHDGEPVLAKDAVASITRWSARDPLGGMIKAIQNELTDIDDRTFKWVLKKPFPKMLLALGKINAPCCFVMPERIAKTDPFRPINEYIGSGPMRFLKDEWVAGSKAVFEKFPSYVPRQEPASWLAGGKRIVTDRIEWIVIPDPATAAAALQNGEVDWVETALPELVPLLRKNRNVVVDNADPLGSVAYLNMNQFVPPFNDVRARRAILMAIRQEDYMHAFVGDDDTRWKPMAGFFTPGTALYNEEGGDILKSPRNFDAAKQLLASTGYAGQPVTCLVAQDIASWKAWGEVTADMLKRLGINVNYAAVDVGTLVSRMAQKSPPAYGGWHLAPVANYGVEFIDPTKGRLSGNYALSGRPINAEVEAEIAAWYEAKSLDEEKVVARQLNKSAFDNVVYAPLGWYLFYHAWRKNVSGIVAGPATFFWGVSKAV
jgi:peptide/nickel transport system substrate-binding protein